MYLCVLKVAETACPTSILILVVHGGSILDSHTEPAVRKSDVTTLRGAFESIMRQHYQVRSNTAEAYLVYIMFQSLVGRVVVKCVPCPAICGPALSVLSRLSPYPAPAPASNDRLPLSAIPVLATAAPDYAASVSQLISLANREYRDFLQSEEGYGFSGQVLFNKTMIC